MRKRPTETAADRKVLALVDRHILPSSGGGTEVVKGRNSRGTLPKTVTTYTDQAAVRNNELHASEQPPPLPAGTK